MIETSSSKKLPRLLIVDDEPDLCELIREALAVEFEVTVAHDGISGLKEAAKLSPDLVLVDLRMPGMDGLTLCRDLRSTAGAETIVMLMTGQEDAELKSFESGADDFVIKPFGTEQLRARIRARLRRKSVANGGGDSTQRVTSGNLELDLARYEARVAGRRVELSALEFKLLAWFVQTEGKIVTRSQVLEANWPGVVVTDRTVDTHVSKLRKAIQGSEFQIHTVYGAGYCWKRSDD